MLNLLGLFYRISQIDERQIASGESFLIHSINWFSGNNHFPLFDNA